MANGNWWDKYKTSGTAVTPEEGETESVAQEGNWWDKYKSTPEPKPEPVEAKPAEDTPQANWWDKYKTTTPKEERDPNKQLLSSWDKTTKEFSDARKGYEQLGARYQELGAKETRTPEEEQELQTTWNSLLNSGFSVQSAQNKVAELQPKVEKFNERQKKARIDYIEDRRGSGVFGDDAANALYDIDARAEQEYTQARTIEDTDKRKEAMAAIQAKYQAEEKDLTNQYVGRFKENETKINNAAEVIGQAFAKGQTVDQFLLETGADAGEFNELRDSLLNQDDPEKGRLFREARAMVDLAEGTKKVGIVNNEIRVSPLHVWDAEGIKSEIEGLDISEAKKQKTIATIPQMQQEAVKVELPFLQQVREFNNFVKDNNLEDVSPQRQISEWKNRNEGWLDQVGKLPAQVGIGLKTGTLGLLEAGQAIVGATALTMGAQNFADPFLDSATKTSDDIQNLTRISKEIGGPTFAAELAAVVPQIVAQIGTGGAIGFGGAKLGLKPKVVSNIGFGSSVGTAFAQSYGGVLSSAFQTLEKEKIDGGMDPVQARAEAVKEAQLPAALSGLSTAVLTTIGGKRGVESPFNEGVEGIKAKLNTAAFRAELPKLVPDIVKGMRNEGYEEFADQLAQGIIEQFSFNPELATSDIINNAFKALAIGGITGGTVEGLKYGFDYMKAPKEMARREASMESIRQSIADVEREISDTSASSPIGAEFQREYDATLPSDEAANLGGVAVDRTRMNSLQAERQQLSELLEDDTISRVARNQLEGKLASADLSYYNEVLAPMRRNVVNEQMVDQLDGMAVSPKTKDGLTAMAKIANGLGAESLTGRERVAVGITSVGEGRFLPSIKNPMVEVNEVGQATVTEAGRLMAENVGMVPLVRMIGLSETTIAKQAEMERVIAEAEARKAQQDAKDTAESEEAKRYGPEAAEALKQQVAVQPPAPEKESNARLAQLLKEQEEAARLGEEAVTKAAETRFIESFRSSISEAIIPTAERAATIDINNFRDVINSIAQEIDKGTFNIELIEQGDFKNILPESAFTTVVEAFRENPQSALNALRTFGDEVENAVKEFGGGAAGEPVENLEPLLRVVRTEQTPEDVTALTEAGLIEIYKDQPVITEAGLAVIPEAERPRLNPEARKIQIDTGASEVVAEAISKGLRIGVDQVGTNVTMPQGWTLDGDIYVPPAPPKEAQILPQDKEYINPAQLAAQKETPFGTVDPKTQVVDATGRILPRYMWHSPPSGLKQDQGVVAYISREAGAQRAIDESFEGKDVKTVWLGRFGRDKGMRQGAFTIDLAKLDPANIMYTGQAEGNAWYRGDIPESAIDRTGTPPVQPPVEPPVVPPVTPPPVAPTASAITEEQANNAIKAAQEERARKPAPTIGRSDWGPQSIPPKQSIGKTVREALKTASRLNLSKIAQSDPNEIMMQDVAAILAELDMPILDLEPIVSLSSMRTRGRARRWVGVKSVVGLPSSIPIPVEILVHEIGHTLTADQVYEYLPRKKVGRGKAYFDAINKVIADPATPEAVSRLFSLYVSTIEQLGVTEQYFGAKGIAGTPKADTSRSMARNLQAKGLLRKDLSGDDLYGLANLEEFVSQTFSEPSFRELLKGLKDPNNPRQSLWQAFVDAIQRILQLPKGSMAAAVIEASVDVGMLVEPARVKARGAAGITPAPAPEPDMAPEPSNPLGYDITNVVEDIKAGRKDGPLRAINNVIEESTELRDRIKRESQRRQKPRARGQAPILERIAKERSSGKISEDTAQALIDFVNTISPDAIGDTAISIRGAGAVSNFDFANSLVSFYLTQDQPEMGARIGIHEFWHGLSRFLPKAELEKMSKDYTRELTKFIDANPWFLAFVGRYSLTPEQFEAYRIFNPKEAETKLVPVFDANGEITKYNILYDKDSYRYIMLDEWIAENMTDLVRQRQGIPDTFLGKLAKVFIQFLDLIESKLGLDPYESFYQLVTDPEKKLQLYRNESVARPFQIYQPQTYDYARDAGELVRYNTLAPEPEVREASKNHANAIANNNIEEAQRLTDEVAAARNYQSQNLLFHATTHIFNVFRKDRANIENDFGKGYYLTNTEADAQINYAGEGPDLTSRIERLAEQLQSNEDMDKDVAKKKAREILNGGGQRIMRVYVRLENPLNVGGPNETFLDYEAPYDETNEEYGEPTGTLVGFLDQLRPIIERYSEDSPVDADKAVGNILEAAFDQGGISASDLVRILKQEDSGIMWASDENGDLASSEIIREAIEAAGFDGIVDNLVNQKFGSQKRIGKAMAGMGPDTVHTIVFDSSQIKSADAATYDDDGNLIPLSQRFLAEEEDVRFAPEEEFEIVPEQVEDQMEGTPEAATIKVMGQAFQMANEQSAAAGTPQGTLPLETITSAWMNSGRDVETLENAIIRYTNLEPEAATTLAQAIGKQVKIQRGIMEISDAARSRKAEKEEEPEVKPYSFAERIREELPRDLRNKINLAYEVLRNEVSVEEANRVMSGLTVDEAIRATEDMNNGVSMPVRSMMAQIVLRKIIAQRKSTKGKKGMEADYKAAVEAHVEFLDFVNDYFKELGQGVQAIARFSDLGADGVLLKVRRDIDKAISKHITNRKGQIDKIKRDVEDADNSAFDAAIKSNKTNIDKTAKKAGEREAKKLTIEEQAQKLAIRAAKKVTGEEVRRRQPDPLSDLVNSHLRRYNANFIAEATAMGVSPVTAQAIEDSAIKLRDSRNATKSERERFKEMQDERMKVKRELARENKYIYGERPTIWENYQDMFSERLARRLMRDPKKKVPPSLLLFTDRLTENLLGFIPESERQSTTQRSFQAMVEDALNNKEKYQEAFNRALEDISFKVMELEAKAAFGEKIPSTTYKKAVAAQEFLERLEPIIQQFPVSDKLITRFVNQKMKAMGESLIGKYNEWYRSSRKTRIEIEKALAEKLVADMNVSNADAINLSRAIVKDFRAKADERREKALARFKKPKEKTKRLSESPLKKFFELVNIGALTDQDAYEVMAHRFELPTWDPKFAKQIEEMALLIEDMPEGLERRRLTRNMMAEIARRKGFSLADLGSGFFYSNMLSSVETFLINLQDTLLGNWINGLASSVADKDFTRLNGLMAGYRKGWVEAINVFNTGLRINMPRLEEKTPLTVELINYGKKGGVTLESTEGMNAIAKTLLESPPAKALNLWKYVTRIMEATDALNYTASSEGQRYAEAARIARDEGLEGKAKQKRINQILNLGDGVYQAALKQAEKEGYTGTDAKFRAMEIQDNEIDAELREKSFERALTDVYRNMPTGLAGFMAASFNNFAMRIANPWFRNAFKLFTAPFVITPTNLFNRWLDYSPYGYKRLFYGSGNLLDKDGPYYIAPPKAGSAEFYTQALKASSSVMVMGLAAGLVKAGLLVLRGIGPSDEEERKQWLSDGNRPHTFSFMGGPQISYQFTPWALVLSWMSNYLNWDQYNAKDDATYTERGVVAMKFAVGVIMDLPFFAGPAEFMEAMQKTKGDPVAALGKYTEGKMGMVFPNLVRQIDRIFDPTIYDSQGLKGIILDQTPFARRLGVQRVNLFGDPIGEDKPVMDRVVGRIISFPPKPSRESRILAKYDIYPYMPSPKQAKALVDGEEAQMTEEQYSKFVQIVGKDVKKRINNLFDPEGEITEQERERGKKQISKIFERARARAVREVSTY
jgi:hypothetical protein